VDAGFLQLAIAAMCEFFFSAHPIFEAIFGAEAKDPKFVERYSYFITALVSESAQSPVGGKPRRKASPRKPK